MNYLNSTSTTTPTIHINLPFLPLDMGLPYWKCRFRIHA